MNLKIKGDKEVLPTERYPSNMKITIEDFRYIDLKEIIGSRDRYGLKSIYIPLADAAKHAMEREEPVKGKTLWLLSDACSMMMNSRSKNDPFSPFWQMEGKRSAILEDFTSDDLAFFAEIVNSVEDYRIKARIADILWTANKPKNIEHVQIAIESYLEYPIGWNSLIHDGNDAWARAIFLAKSIGKTGFDQLAHIRETLYEALKNAPREETFYPSKLSKLLDEAGMDEEKSIEIANLMEEIARGLSESRNWMASRSYSEAAIDWFKSLGESSKVAKLRNDIASAWNEEAESRFAEANYLAAGIFFDNAIKAHRAIPREHRGAFDTETKLREIHLRMNEANRLSVGNMHRIETPDIDVSKSIEVAIKHIKERNYPDVLHYFAHIAKPEEYSQLRESAKETMGASMIRHLAPSISLATDGRVTGKSRALNPLDTDDAANEEALSSEMMMHFSIGVGLSVHSLILPALQQLLLEHRVTEEMLLEQCGSSAIVPIGREKLWAKGLYFGFEGDYATAIHLLSPQLEHFVRLALKENGAKTSTIDTSGIETENGLSTLLDKFEAKQIFVEGLLFEIKALMASPHGPNLRNVIAHGLMNEDEAESQYAVYLWWRMLSMMLDAIFVEIKDEHADVK